MASAWGKSWGGAWGSAWGTIAQTAPNPSGGSGGLVGYPIHKPIIYRRRTRRERERTEALFIFKPQ